MADYITARNGGFEPLLTETLPSLAAAANPFANAPEKTRVVLLTLRGAGVTMRFDGGTASAGSNGHDYATSTTAPYEFVLSKGAATKVSAIQSGGTATGWITYLGVA